MERRPGAIYIDTVPQGTKIEQTDEGMVYAMLPNGEARTYEVTASSEVIVSRFPPIKITVGKA